MATSAITEEVKRKLEYIIKIAGEAEALLEDINVNPANYELMEMLQVQSEMVGVLLDQLRSGKSNNDQVVDSRFKRTAQKFLELKRAELAIDLDEVEMNYVDELKNKDYRPSTRK